MKSGVRANQISQREKTKLTADAIKKRITNVPFGKETKDWVDKWAEYESVGGVGFGIFNVPPIIERAEGPYLYDPDGKEYIDFLSGFSVSALGNNDKGVTEVIQKQAAKLTHYFDFPHIERIKLSEKLCKTSGMSGKTKVAFGVTGSDGIELAIRAARYFTGQPYILTAYGDYHGVTYGTMGLTSKGNMQPYFYPVLPNRDIGFIPFPHDYRSPQEQYPGYDMSSLKVFRRMLEGKETPYTDGVNGINNVAAILVEPFQSSAGYYIPPVEYLQELREIADQFGMLLIVDEIQSGLARSGKLWSYEHSGIEPDMIVTSKALGGGVPISAVIARAEILEEWGPGAHVSTQAGNALACAAGNYILDTISSDEFLSRVNERGKYLMDELQDLRRKHPIIGYIDNCGMYTGVELVSDRKTKEPASTAATLVRDRCVEEGLVFEKGGYYHNRMQLIPALTIDEEVLRKAIQILDKVFGEAESKFNIG